MKIAILTVMKAFKLS